MLCVLLLLRFPLFSLVGVVVCCFLLSHWTSALLVCCFAWSQQLGVCWLWLAGVALCHCVCFVRRSSDIDISDATLCLHRGKVVLQSKADLGRAAATRNGLLVLPENDRAYS